MGVLKIVFVTMVCHMLCSQAFEEDLLDQFQNWRPELSRRSPASQCVDKNRQSLLLCARKFPDSKAEFAECAQGFIHGFPACFFLKTGEVDDCNEICVEGLSQCTKSSQTLTERVICLFGGEKCKRSCSESQQKKEKPGLQSQLEELVSSRREITDRGISTQNDNRESKRVVDDINKEVNTVLLGLKKRKKSAPKFAEKRSACRNNCMGLYDACLRNSKVRSENDYNICLIARGECERFC